MPNAQTIRRVITAILMQAAMLYGCIFAANWFSLKACSTAYFPPSVHCQWDISWIASAFAKASAERSQ
jgi:hypothetical protein